MDKRAELLEELSQIEFAAYLTNLVSEGCYELTTLTSEGISYEWIAYDEWTAYILKPCSKEKWIEIRMALQEGSLTSKILEKTQFSNLLTETVGDMAEYSSFMSGLLEMPLDFDKEIYCYYNSFDNTFSFVTSIEKLKAILSKEYPAQTLWSELDTNDLEYWLERYKDEEDSIALCYFKD